MDAVRLQDDEGNEVVVAAQGCGALWGYAITRGDATTRSTRVWSHPETALTIGVLRARIELRGGAWRGDHRFPDGHTRSEP